MRCYKVQSSEKLAELKQYVKEESAKKEIENIRKVWSVIERTVPKAAQRVVCFVSVSRGTYLFAKLPAWSCTKNVGSLKKTSIEFAENNLELMGDTEKEA